MIRKEHRQTLRELVIYYQAKAEAMQEAYCIISRKATVEDAKKLEEVTKLMDKYTDLAREIVNSAGKLGEGVHRPHYLDWIERED